FLVGALFFVGRSSGSSKLKSSCGSDFLGGALLGAAAGCFCVGAAGEEPPAGTEMSDWHLGHLTFLPAAVSGALHRALHDGHEIAIGMDLLPMSARPGFA